MKQWTVIRRISLFPIAHISVLYNNYKVEEYKVFKVSFFKHIRLDLLPSRGLYVEHRLPKTLAEVTTFVTLIHDIQQF